VLAQRNACVSSRRSNSLLVIVRYGMRWSAAGFVMTVEDCPAGMGSSMAESDAISGLQAAGL
jgi:hypothetical protein